MKRKNLIKVILITGLAGLMTVALFTVMFVGCGHRSCPVGSQDADKHVEWVSQKIANRLNLSTEQKTGLEEIVTDLNEKRKEGRSWRQSIRQDVINLVRQDHIGRKDIDRLVDTHRQHMDRMIAYLSDGIIEFHSLLTSEQREKLAEAIEKHEPGQWRRCRFNQ